MAKAKSRTRSRSTAQPTRTIDLYQNKIILIAILIIALFVVLASLQQRINFPKVEGTNTGFDELGYNRTARIFEGKADGVDGTLDGTAYGSALYGNDHLKMKWNAEWDRGNDEGWNDPSGYQAWIDNNWNGKVRGGSGEVWQYRIKWVGSCGADGTPRPDGSYCIWGQFAVILSQGTVANTHFWDAHAVPTGFGNY